MGSKPPVLGWADNGKVEIDLPALMKSRMLIQANSGGGKSYTLRRVLEQTAPHVQQLIIDPDGEFATLREKFDYIICAPKGADAIANPQTAAALALALWKSGSSAILDIYELQKHERVLFVRRFLEALIAAPKSAWHATLVALDEIHDFCPQTGSAESSPAVIDLATRGRKRGLCLVGATQRIAKLHKDCAAELLNKCIGRTGLDIDVARAADELGLPKGGAMETLRNLNPDKGEFFVFGPALCASVIRVNVGPVVTTHPETGAKAMTAPPPASAKVRAQLAKIEGLKKDAEIDEATMAGLTATVTQLRRELAAKPKPVPPPAPVDLKPISAAVESARMAIERVDEAIRDVEVLKRGYVTAELRKLTKPIDVYAPTLELAREGMAKVIAACNAAGASSLKPPEKRILDSLAWWRAAGFVAPTKHQVAFVARYTVNGHFNNTLSGLKARDLINYPNAGLVGLMDAGAALADGPVGNLNRAELFDRITDVLRTEPQRRLFKALAEADTDLSRAMLAKACDYTVNGHFSNVLGSLKSLGLVEYPSVGLVRLARWINV